MTSRKQLRRNKVEGCVLPLVFLFFPFSHCFFFPFCSVPLLSNHPFFTCCVFFFVRQQIFLFVCGRDRFRRTRKTKTKKMERHPCGEECAMSAVVCGRLSLSPYMYIYIYRTPLVHHVCGLIAVVELPDSFFRALLDCAMTDSHHHDLPPLSLFLSLRFPPSLTCPITSEPPCYGFFS